MWKHYIMFYYILIVIRYISCCQCNFNHTDLNKEKRELFETEEFTATEYLDNTPEIDTKETTLEYATSTNQYQTTFLDIHEITTGDPENTTLVNIFDINENSSEVMEALFNESESKYDSDFLRDSESTAEKLNERGETEREPCSDDLKKKCRRYKNGNTFKLDKMTGVWQVAYYRLQSKTKCFKINIKLVKVNEQQRYARVYGSFNDTINWERCFLEITSTESAYSDRRHFLQGKESDRGVMANFIIDEEYAQNTIYLTLHSEGGDQWLVINNLLLMRDCDNGDFVVFTRYPKKPRRADIMIALRKFGENNPKGTMACNIEKPWLTHEGEISENHDHSVKKYEEKRNYTNNITAGVSYNTVVDL